MLTDAQWTLPEPLAEQRRPKGKPPPQDLRRPFEAIVWEHQIWGPQNGAQWRLAPSELRPWRRAVATRLEKTAPSFMGILCFAAALHWLEP
jgi:transposase